MEIYSELNKEELRKVGLTILDQTQQKLCNNQKIQEINITRKVLLKKLKEIENFTDVCGLTLTLKKKYHNDDDKWIHRHIQAKINNSRVWKDIKYILIPEYTKNGVLHYHGVIWDSYQIKVIKCVKWWRRTFGFVKPELKINKYSNWMKYIIKDYGKTGLWTLYNIK